MRKWRKRQADKFGNWELDIFALNRSSHEPINTETANYINLIVHIAEKAYKQGLNGEPFWPGVPIKRSTRQ